MEEWEKEPDLKFLKCIDIAIDFNNIYCRFELPSKKKVTYRSDNAWKREISLFSMKLVDSSDYGNHSHEAKRSWFAEKLTIQKTAADFCGLFSSFIIASSMLIIGHGMFISQYNLEQKKWEDKHDKLPDVVRCVFDRSYTSVEVNDIGVLYGPNNIALYFKTKE